MSEASDILPREIERKYLLRSAPDLDGLSAERVVEMDQGYIPGVQIHERLRRVQSGDEVTHIRTIKLGRGVSRVEVEEDMPPLLFEKMWQLTEGRRLRKRRHYITDAGRLWELDVFLDRDLVLLEVELESEVEEVALPAWAQSRLVREVTDEDAYVNLNLAR